MPWTQLAVKRGAKLKPLQCIPLVLKDIFDTADMPTTGGSLALEGHAADEGCIHGGAVPSNRSPDPGENEHARTGAGRGDVEFAGRADEESLRAVADPRRFFRRHRGGPGGELRDRGTGSDTVNSIRSPSSANSLVGIRPTRGLISRAGVIPVSFTQDAVGPITRTVADAAVMLDVMAGYDPDDPVTAFGVGKIPSTYTAFLDRNGLKGARIGVLRTLFGSGPDHQEVNRVMANALEVLKKQGAILVEIDDAAFDTGELSSDLDVQKYEYKFDLNNYLKAQPNAPVHSLAELIATGKYHKPSLEKFLASAESYENGLNEPDYKDRRVKIDDLRVQLANADGEKQRGRVGLSAPEAAAGDDRRHESGGAQWHPGRNHGISGDYGSGRIFDADGECPYWHAGRDRIPWPAVQRAAVVEDCLQL